MGGGSSVEATLGRVKSLMAESLTAGYLKPDKVEEVKAECEKLFQKYDADKSGKLERNEMNKLASDLQDMHCKFVAQAGKKATPQDENIGIELVSMWDRDKSNSLTFHEFSAALIRVVQDDFKK